MARFVQSFFLLFCSKRFLSAYSTLAIIKYTKRVTYHGAFLHEYAGRKQQPIGFFWLRAAKKEDPAARTSSQ